jgi:5'-phosphate synthase pdxT subunit
MSKKIIGILALQGDFEKHEAAVAAAGGIARPIRSAAGLASIDGLIIPGGESTTMLKLIGYENLWEPLAAFARVQPVFGTCAGAILLAKEVTSPAQACFGLLDITVERNAYGRQLDSHIANIDLDGLPFEAVFIRAPIIRRAGVECKVLAAHRGDPVLVSEGRHLVATFHPELTCDPRVHEIFLQRL